MSNMIRIVVGITGASGVVYGARFMEALKDLKVESHLILSSGAREVLKHETPYESDQITSLASFSYSEQDLSAPLASGSYKTDGMVVIPCSLKTLAGIAHGISENLMLRAAEVSLKERRPLVLVPRETPLSLIQIENMVSVARAGATILPAMPGFYHNPKTVEALVDHVVGKVLDQLGLEHDLFTRWKGGLD